MESLELLANNVANASTGGYKADREFYSLYASSEAEGDPTATMPLIEKPWIDFSQGMLHNTGNSLDLALKGKGFFAVEGPSGPLYTRNGSFSLAKDGRLVTAEGYAVRSSGGGTLTLQANRPIEILSDGTVRQDGNVAGQIELADFDASAPIAKHGSNYFRVSGTAARSTAAVEQGKLEASNTGTAESAVRLVSVLRQFEMLQKAVSLSADMNRRAVEEVAKV
jgi:flagellar basal body rod protein FlgG